MTIKYLSASIFVCASILTGSTVSYACDTAEYSTFAREKISLATLNSDSNQANLYNFRTRQCMLLHNNVEMDMSSFLPSDETSLGMYQFYRDKGKNKIDALKYTLEFMVTEQQS